MEKKIQTNLDKANKRYKTKFEKDKKILEDAYAKATEKIQALIDENEQYNDKKIKKIKKKSLNTNKEILMKFSELEGSNNMRLKSGIEKIEEKMKNCFENKEIVNYENLKNELRQKHEKTRKSIERIKSQLLRNCNNK